jgi:outer membrane protein TolC
LLVPHTVDLMLFAWVLALPAADSAGPLDLTTAVEAALGANPEILRSREVVEEAREIKREVTAEAFPQVTFEVNTFRFRDPGILNDPNFQTLEDLPADQSSDGTSFLPEEVFQPIQIDQYGYALTVEQPVFTWGRVPGARRVARRALDGVKLDVEETELDVARRVALAFHGLQLARHRLEVFEAERTSREAQVRRAQDLLETGAGTRLDLLRARVELANLEPRILQARQEGAQARARLNEAMGRPVDQPVEIDGPDLTAGTAPPPAPGTLQQMAEARRPALRKFPVDRYLLEQQAKIARADLRPQLNFEGSYGSTSFDYDNLTDPDFRSWRLGLTASWTLFDGLRTPARVAQFHSRVSQNQLEENGFRLALAREIETALGDWREATAARAASKRAVEQAREARRVAEESYTWGAATSLDVLDAQRALREAELSLARAVHDQAVALVSLKFLAGVRADHPFPEPVASPHETGESQP